MIYLSASNFRCTPFTVMKHGRNLQLFSLTDVVRKIITTVLPLMTSYEKILLIVLKQASKR